MVLFWHRRDLRITDNTGLYRALKNEKEVQPVFVFDTTILQHLPSNDQRVLFIHQEIERLKKEYAELGCDFRVFYGDPKEIIPHFAIEKKVSAVYTNRDYEPNALSRDKAVYEELMKAEIEFKGYKDHVIFEKNEVVKADGNPYTVFTPYSRKWLEKLNPFYLRSYPTEKYYEYLKRNQEKTDIPSLEKMGFKTDNFHPFPSREFDKNSISVYDEKRDFPAIEGTSKLGLHLRFGTISIRELARVGQEKNAIYLKELIWRDFYQAILYHFPHSAKDSFRPEYDRIKWLNDEALFELWCAGKTGYPIVDAGMRELNATGYMHNRVRMIVASFLTKHLLIDWRWGEAYFAEKLLDFDLASNTGGWQWAAGCGCDAAPYFRVFNPASQQEKFDKEARYIRKWVPEYGTPTYLQPCVEHKMARERAISHYKYHLSKG